jgi:glycosyltransferase involved in cell wall biosynthesis
MIRSHEHAAARSAAATTCLPRLSLHLHTVAQSTDSRFMKQANSLLRAGLANRVVLLGQSKTISHFDEEMGPGIRLIRLRCRLAALPKFKLCGCLKYAEFIGRQIWTARSLGASFIQCHSVAALPAAVSARFQARIPMVYDARELETECNGLRGLNQRFTRTIERNLIPYCDAVLCVSDSIADWYAHHYDVPRPFVVRNVPDLRDRSGPRDAEPLRERLRIARDAIIFIYSGAFYPGRRIEEMIRVFRRARQDRHLVFLGFGPLERLIREASEANPNIHFLPAVATGDVVSVLGSADVGLAGHLEPTCLNHRYALPNKFFENLLAGLPVWVNDVHVEMATLVRRYGFGWVTPYGEQEMIDWVNGLAPAELRVKRELAVNAKNYFSWENEERNLICAYRHAQQSAGLRFGISDLDEKSSLSSYSRR